MLAAQYTPKISQDDILHHVEAGVVHYRNKYGLLPSKIFYIPLSSEPVSIGPAYYSDILNIRLPVHTVSLDMFETYPLIREKSLVFVMDGWRETGEYSVVHLPKGKKFYSPGLKGLAERVKNLLNLH